MIHWYFRLANRYVWLYHYIKKKDKIGMAVFPLQVRKSVSFLVGFLIGYT